MKRIFLAYPFALGEVPNALQRAFAGEAVVETASSRLTSLHILEKIQEQMRESDLCLFDLTLHNVNVALEFGVARGAGYQYRLLYWEHHPDNPRNDVFSDARGWDSLRYNGMEQLEEQARRRILPELSTLSAPKKLPDSSARPYLNALLRSDFNPLTQIAVIQGKVWNDGPGVASRVRGVLNGFGESNFRANGLSHRPDVSIGISVRFDNQPYIMAGFPGGMQVQFEDADGVKYEQTGSMRFYRRDDPRKVTYELDGLNAPRVIEKFTLQFDQHDILER